MGSIGKSSDCWETAGRRSHLDIATVIAACFKGITTSAFLGLADKPAAAEHTGNFVQLSSYCSWADLVIFTFWRLPRFLFPPQCLSLSLFQKLRVLLKMLGILFGPWKGTSVLSSKKVSVRFYVQHPSHRVENSKAMLVLRRTISSWIPPDLWGDLSAKNLRNVSVLLWMLAWQCFSSSSASLYTVHLCLLWEGQRTAVTLLHSAVFSLVGCKVSPCFFCQSCSPTLPEPHGCASAMPVKKS